MKSITYAYHSSPNAETFNKGRACWLITLGVSKPIVCEDTPEGAHKALKIFLDSELPVHPDSFTLGDIRRIFNGRGYSA